ncbi:MULTISPECIES: hypothetical protein [unclassified Pseudoclavibacter]|uniref:hypothetical protein n=1 Tax=unclassified Pseudoclavibacter TaxID=2615177 RepID=UPI000CE7C9A0|nr:MULTISPECIES: hypothetical protein [unclassified Pseudoclavibacter]PPF40091.1 hypothetical protein C5E05_02460 [Pseudoclavibacter sp. AY1H1]PPF75907.1 hypothetical protein C5B99_08530 [Pseudoclavibacter sp. Z016]PPG02806.1 hypothetical protein C5E06_10170 [Pseudoclavibacter sp. RFBI5]
MAWSVPVIAAAVAAPHVSASQLCSASVDFNTVATNGTNSSTGFPSAVSSVTLATGTPAYRVRITQTDSVNTQFGTASSFYNFSQSARAWTNNDQLATLPGPAGRLILNQRRPAGSSASPVYQRVRFEIINAAGVAVDVTNFRITLDDINKTANHDDVIAFVDAPATVVASYGNSTGTGTVTNPFRRANTDGVPAGSPTTFYRDTFDLGAVPASGTRLDYVGGTPYGWQYVTISALSFTAPGAC